MYTYYDRELVSERNKYTIWFILAGVALLIFLLTLIVIGLSRGEELVFTEQSFADYSTLSTPTATCLEYHRQVLSTVEWYEEFIDDCEWTATDLYQTSDFSTGVVVLYFVKDSVIKRPFAFHDYPFMVDDHEVIEVRYRAWPEEEDAWYVYFVEMDKDQIASADVIFD